jgi:hypothetical protein
MTLLALLLGFQDVPKSAAGFTATEWLAGATAVITTGMLVWEKIKKQSKEDRADTVAGFQLQADGERHVGAVRGGECPAGRRGGQKEQGKR